MSRTKWKYRLYPTPIDKRWPRLWRNSSSTLILCVGSLIRLLMRQHSLLAINLPQTQSLLHQIYAKRNRSIVSVMNHSGTWDDLCVTSLLANCKSQLSNPDYMRLTPVAADICFKNWFSSVFFSLGNCVPAYRTLRDPKTGAVQIVGHGVYQESFNFLVSELKRGGRWVNILPQGRVIVGPEKAKETEIRFRWGVGRLIADSEPTPIVLPIWHEGVETINPLADNVFQYFWFGLQALCRGGLPITVNFGEPLDLTPLVQRLKQEGATREAMRIAITDKVQECMMKLRAETIKLHEKRL
ncbi:hypothetical protein BOX15_Mlig010617g2 [Macrostomum lignano]|uniref:Uncharacterized protein n=2 Tax=Macrostomum lignano TaxID=282301 RepID=A0A267GQ77_9PLAT|nr:hypothetical protein BOX15_Mlig010617g2 [Macrostomum lignano]